MDGQTDFLLNVLEGIIPQFNYTRLFSLYFPRRTYVPLLTDKNQQKVILEIFNPFIARILG